MNLKEVKDEYTFHATVRNEGRVTIPLATRKALGIKKGDIVELQVVVRKVTY